MATNRRWTDETGQVKEEVTFHDCRCWGRSGEVIGQQFIKGKPILIHGRQAQEQWEDKATGKPRRKTLNIVEHWEYAGDLRGVSSGGPSRPTPESGAGVGTATGKESMGEVFGGDGDGDEIPFRMIPTRSV
jgi:single stranded DNA-binding protein